MEQAYCDPENDYIRGKPPLYDDEGDIDDNFGERKV